MIALLGPPPLELIERSHSMKEFKLPESVWSQDGKPCETAEEYFGGPFFDKEGIPTPTYVDSSVWLSQEHLN